jgi:septal ring factor EnvC (AmiA/AmiB activator)
VLTYHQYLARERAAQLDALRAKVERLAALEGSIRAESADLARLQDRLQREKADLEQARARRRAALADLESELDRSTRRLDHLRETRRELEALVERVGAGLADIPASLDETPPFAAMAGRLPWPLEGPIRHPFGTARGVGNLSWEGVVLAADAGDMVRAVHHGRVAFAGWLRGYGLLIIVDHGDGFMTLYGHNQSLLKETGDWVATGEVVATAGTSGGRREPGLYFEVRRNATPQDPVRWCRRG